MATDGHGARVVDNGWNTLGRPTRPFHHVNTRGSLLRVEAYRLQLSLAFAACSPASMDAICRSNSRFTASSATEAFAASSTLTSTSVISQ